MSSFHSQVYDFRPQSLFMSIIEMSKDCEAKVVNFVVKRSHEFSEDKFDMLSQATIQMFVL